MAVTLGIYGYYRMAVKYDEKGGIPGMLPFVELGLLFVTVAVNLFFMGKVVYDKCK